MTDVEESEWCVGTATRTITPEEPMRMAGYGAREEPAEGTLEDLHARAVAIEDGRGTRFVAVGVEVLAISRPLHDEITEACEEQYDLLPTHLLLNASHTHCGPVYRRRKTEVFSLDDEERAQAEEYREFLIETLIGVVGEAIEDREPATLEYSHARCGIAMNRRLPVEEGIGFQPYPEGPVDHDVPVVVAESEEEIQAILFGYACHPTSLFRREWSGDWAGYAMDELEAEYPEATAVFLQGCGGDQKAYPQRELELTKHYGKALATAVRGALSANRRPVNGPMRCVKEEVDLEFERPPSREELESRVADDDLDRYVRRHAEHLLSELDEHGELPRSHPYPIQAIGFGGDLTMVALTGEVLVGYSLKLKERLPGPLWVAGYSNNYMTYIPTVDDLYAGGYEADRFVHLTELPARFDHSVEDRVLSTATALARRVGPPGE